MEELTGDGVHPNDRGHALIADAIIYALKKAEACLEENNGEEEILPLTERATVMLDGQQTGIVLDGTFDEAEIPEHFFEFISIICA